MEDRSKVQVELAGKGSCGKKKGMGGFGVGD